jgi:hypothetical protein
VSKSDNQNTTQHDAPVATPAADLGELWQTLDVLPEAETPEDLLATTIEMIAVDGTHHRSGRSNRFSKIPTDLWQWFAPAIAVGISIILGYFVGQATIGTQQQEPFDWRARREEVLKSTIQEAIENNPSGARKFFQQQLRNSQGTQGQTMPPQQNSKKGSRTGGMNPSVPKNSQPVPLDGQERNGRLRGKQPGLLKGPGDQRRQQPAGAPVEVSSP